MANEELLEILKQGSRVWNEWRINNPDVKVDLYQANFRETSFRRANLIGADLRRTDFKGANLTGSDLSGADLRRAHIMDANLTGANLTRANLSFANIQDANLSYATLEEAILRGTVITKSNFWGAVLIKSNLLEANLSMVDLAEADFTDADLTGSRMTGILFGKNDLSATFGLDTVFHAFPSTIGIDTIRKSKGKFPIKFLRGCGLSDLDIEYVKLANPDLTEKEITDITYKIYELRSKGVSISFNSVFISYSFKDKDFAQKLHDDLQNNGVRCWFAPHDIQGGRKIHEQVDAAIRTHDRLLLILSEHSMNSEWVKTEIANARQKEIEEKRQVLFPISIIAYQKIRDWKNFDADTGKDSAREIREYYIPNFSRWQEPTAYGSSFKRLLQDLKA